MQSLFGKYQAVFILIENRLYCLQVIWLAIRVDVTMIALRETLLHG